MSMNDLMSDYVARVNNALMAGHTSVTVLKNKLITNVTKKLVTLGYFQGFEEDKGTLTIQLVPEKIKKIKRRSKPGQRQYVTYTDLPRIIGGIGHNIITTSSGIMTQVESKKHKQGGELLFQIYS